MGKARKSQQPLPNSNHADLRENAHRQDHHARGRAVGLDRQRQGEDPGQGGHPARPAAPHLRGQAARGRPHALRLQHPEGVDAAPRPPPAWRRAADSGHKLVVIDFTATWCGPCQRIGPKFVAFAEKYPDVVFIKVDVDENEEVAAECGISAMPTFHYYKNKTKVDELVGASEASLEEKIVANK